MNPKSELKPVKVDMLDFYAHLYFRRELRKLVSSGKYSPQAADSLRIKHFGSVAAYWA